MQLLRVWAISASLTTNSTWVKSDSLHASGLQSFLCPGAWIHWLMCCSNRPCVFVSRFFLNRRNVLNGHICPEYEPSRTAHAKDIPPLTGDEVRVRTGRRMFEAERAVQDSWRACYWTRFTLCRANRIWRDRTCVRLQRLRREWSVLYLLNVAVFQANGYENN